MWSGDPQYSQWALNPSAYQNVAHEEVDWAALAQQWIQMKETLPSDQIPPAPPPPPIGKDTGEKKKDELEGGEAPMDMDTKEDQDNSNSSNTQSGDANSWGTWPNWQQWGWNWNSAGGMVPPGGVPPPNQPVVPGKAAAATGTVAVPPYAYPQNSQAYSGSTGVYDYNHAGGSEHYGQVMAGGYWTSGSPSDASGVPPGPAAGVSPLMRPNRHDWRRNNNRSHDRIRTSEKSDDEEDMSTVLDSGPTLDAAKRRQLPAWIREGLEKMEREKQKKMDRERQMKEREAYLQKKREEEENAMNELEKNSGQPMIPKKSKFESDSEESTRGDSPTPSQSSLKRKSRFRNADSPNSSPRQPANRFPSTEPEPMKSREEQMQEIMLKVRRTLTEILLEVTTEEMEAVAHEVLNKAKAKAPAMQLRKTQALASLTGRLGLGMYGDSEDSDSGDEGVPDSPSRANGADSDEELRDQIQKRKMEFLKTEREIEARLEEEEEREKERERHLMGEESGESDVEERQVENQTDSKHLVQKGPEEEEDKKKVKILHPQDHVKQGDTTTTNRDYFTTPSVKKSTRDDVKSERSVDNSKVDRRVRQSPRLAESPVHKKSEKSSESSYENDDSSSKSNSDSSSSSDSRSSSRSSSSESRRSSKKSSRSGRSVESLRRSDKRKSGGNRKHSRSRSRESDHVSKKSDRKYSRREGRREHEKDRRERDKKDRRRSRSRSRSETRSRDGHESRKIKDDRRSSRHELDKSRDSERRSSNSGKPRAYRHDSLSPSKKSSRGKRRSRHSSGSSSPSSKRRDSHRGDKRGRYSHSRSISPPRRKKSRRRRSSSSSRSTQSFERERALGKKSGHGRND